MKRLSLLTIIFIFFASSCSPDFYKYNIDLGIKAAKMRLWKEALYRFKRAATYKETAKAYNNMAVAYEALGDFKAAEKCYLKALALDPRNEKIRANYAIFQELKKRHSPKKKPGSSRKETRRGGKK